MDCDSAYVDASQESPTPYRQTSGKFPAPGEMVLTVANMPVAKPATQGTYSQIRATRHALKSSNAVRQSRESMARSQLDYHGDAVEALREISSIERADETVQGDFMTTTASGKTAIQGRSYKS